jgi:hypothetical protein
MKLSEVDTIVNTKKDWDRITHNIRHLQGDSSRGIPAGQVSVMLDGKEISLGHQYVGPDTGYQYRKAILAAALEYQAVLKQRLALLGVDDFEG